VYRLSEFLFVKIGDWRKSGRAPVARGDDLTTLEKLIDTPALAGKFFNSTRIEPSSGMPTSCLADTSVLGSPRVPSRRAEPRPSSSAQRGTLFTELGLVEDSHGNWLLMAKRYWIAAKGQSWPSDLLGCLAMHLVGASDE
jgi:hypothetical protein